MSATRIDRILGFEHGLPPAYAAMVALVGLIFLVFGWRLHRLTLAACGFFIGSLAGALLAKWIGVDLGWGIAVGGLALLLLANPLAKAVLFIVAGTSLGICAGEAARLVISPGAFPWGFFPGFAAGGFLSMWQMRALVMMSTSFLGALAFAWGTIAALASLGMPWLCGFQARHPTYYMIILGLIFLVGLLAQRKLSQVGDRNKEGI
ncbi:MAG TPA: hypothetical protein VM425_01755 [Myxococcota bacterium]|nr:hypothetical protein [Myxococcota bacterium]